MTKESEWPYRWDQLLRYRLIEIVALWEGRLTTNHLCNSFGIGRQQASKDINFYINHIAVGNLEYDSKLKGYKPTVNFIPKLTTGVADEYLHVLSRNKDINHTFAGLDLGFTHTEMIKIPIRKTSPEVIRIIIQAAREKKRVEIDYMSMRDSSTDSRVIVPHTLVCTHLRWHVRAYCEKNGEFRDFVLSRFRGKPEIVTDAFNFESEDEKWNTFVRIKIKPDPGLNEMQKEIVEQDYNMLDGVLVIEARAALVNYTLQALNIDPNKREFDPSAQQIIIENYTELKPYLFN